MRSLGQHSDAELIGLGLTSIAQALARAMSPQGKRGIRRPQTAAEAHTKFAGQSWTIVLSYTGDHLRNKSLTVGTYCVYRGRVGSTNLEYPRFTLGTRGMKQAVIAKSLYFLYAHQKKTSSMCHILPGFDTRKVLRT